MVEEPLSIFKRITLLFLASVTSWLNELKGWKRDEIKVFYKSGKVIKSVVEGLKGMRPTRTECLWSNPNLQKALEEEWLNLGKAA